MLFILLLVHTRLTPSSSSCRLPVTWLQREAFFYPPRHIFMHWLIITAFLILFWQCWEELFSGLIKRSPGMFVSFQRRSLHLCSLISWLFTWVSRFCSSREFMVTPGLTFAMELW